jgi:hypothetical protein
MVKLGGTGVARGAWRVTGGIIQDAVHLRCAVRLLQPVFYSPPPGRRGTNKRRLGWGEADRAAGRKPTPKGGECSVKCVGSGSEPAGCFNWLRGGGRHTRQAVTPRWAAASHTRRCCCLVHHSWACYLQALHARIRADLLSSSRRGSPAPRAPPRTRPPA